MLRKITNLMDRIVSNSNTYMEHQSSSLESQYDSNNIVLKLSEDVINQIKGHQEQKSLIDELIPNEELRKRYKKYGLCEECSQPNTGYKWCQSCNSKHFQQDFNKWTSGNKEIDEFIQNFQLNATCQQEVLEWVPYEKFRDIEYLAEGGFGTVHKAFWIDGYIFYWDINQNKWYRDDNEYIVLKCLNNSQNLTTDFLQEITLHKTITDGRIVSCFGISQDQKTKNFMMVMQYIKNGSMCQYLKSNYTKLSLYNKLILLRDIVQGLKQIHKKGFIHKDLHSGNILSGYFKSNLELFHYVSRRMNEGYVHDDLHSCNTLSYSSIGCYITDLGLCKPVDEKGEKLIHGVLPYVAPEVLRGKTYTQPADIYSFGILTYEILSGLPPYYHLPYDEFLALKICQGLRPKFNNVKVPLLLENLVDQCLDANPLNRPTADQLVSIFNDWWNDIYHKEGTIAEFYKQCKEAEEFNQSITSKLNTSSSYTTHPQAIYISRLLDYKNLPEPQNSKEINDQFYNSSDSLASLQIDSQKIKIFNLTKEKND